MKPFTSKTNQSLAANLRVPALTAILLTLLSANAVQAGSSVSYSGGTYAQDFNSLPNPGATSVNAANPVIIPATTGTKYTFNNSTTATAFDFANAVDTSGTATTTGTGGLGLSSTMSGWYGGASGGSSGIKFGASNGDQTTGGDISFGLASSSDRALGLIATSSAGATYFGLAIVNNTGAPISLISTAFTWEFWKQGTLAKTVNFNYTVDNTNALNLISAATSASAVNLSNSPNEATGAAGPIDGTQAANQSSYNSGPTALNTSLAPNGTLWLTWQQTNAGSSGQGFGVDNFTFQAVPEPGTYMLLGIGLLVCGQRFLRRKRA